MRSYLLLLLAFPALLLAGPSPAGDASWKAAGAVGLNDLHVRDALLHVYNARDGMGHGHEHGSHAMAAPLTELDEEEIAQWNGPTPPSYWTIDIEERDPKVQRYPWLMALHILFMSIAFFGALPAGIALRSVKHAWHGAAVVTFWASAILGCATSGLYRKLTPNMYEHAKHATHSYFILFGALVLTGIDVLSALKRLFYYVKSVRAKEQPFSLRTLWQTVVLAKEQHVVLGHLSEYNHLVEEPEEMEEGHHEGADEGQWVNGPNRQSGDYPGSPASERTVFGTRSPKGSQNSSDDLPSHLASRTAPTKGFLRKAGSAAFATTERVLVFAAFGQLLEGIVVYTGGCRGNYLNGCLAHLIKGGIFWCYGLVTFARFLGAFADLGWAWNITPAGSSAPSAEFVESAVVFTYGITNTWMERFGAQPGDPYTTKQIQHIGIAVMFWFAGLVGMGLESSRVRRWLLPSSIPTPAAESALANYRGGNPFPALVIGVTGAAMAAHFQKYLFQVQVHALWGQMLLGFAALRCATCVVGWLRPPTTVAPGRPPTEALGSFFLACGGLLFMLSTEEVSFAAIRKGRDDVMMFLNVAVAITCFSFCWTLCVVAFKGWLKTRANACVSSSSLRSP